MTRDMRLYIADILESVAKIRQYTGNLSEEDFLADTQIQDAVFRRLEVIGEAAKNVPDDFRNKYPEIPWRKVAGLRDVLIHEYFGVNVRRVWKVAKQDVLDLERQLSIVRDDLNLP